VESARVSKASKLLVVVIVDLLRTREADERP
jgi:hypothetical protein